MSWVSAAASSLRYDIYSATATIRGLHRRARYRAVSAEDATVAGLRAQPDRTSAAFIGNHTSVDWHLLSPGRAAMWTGNDGVEHGTAGI
jgi:predicted kinase